MKHFLISVVLTAVTLPSNGQVSFGVVADAQYSRTSEVKHNRFYSLSSDKLREAVGTFDSRNVDFVVSLGDIVDRNIAEYADIEPIIDSLSAPFYHILGNHDFTLPHTRRNNRHIAKRLHLAQPYYYKVINGFRFIFMNSNDISLYGVDLQSAKYNQAKNILDSLKRISAINAHDWNSAIGQHQLLWLDRELSKADKYNEPVIIFSHSPLLPFDNIHTLWNSAEVVATLERHHCVRAVFSGHNHKGAYEYHNNIYYVTFTGMVEGEDNSYAVITCTDDGITVDGYGSQQSYSFHTSATETIDQSN